MKLKLLIILCVFLLQGCYYQTVDYVEIKKAIDFCSAKGGLREIKEFFHAETKFVCVNGAGAFEK